MTGYGKSFWLTLIIMLAAFFGGGVVLSGVCENTHQDFAASVLPSADTDDCGNMSETSRTQENSALELSRCRRLFRLGVTQDNSGRIWRVILRTQNFADVADMADVCGKSGVFYLRQVADYAFFCEYIVGIMPVRAGPVC